MTLSFRIASMSMLCLLFLTRCEDKNAYKKVDVSGVKVDLNIARFEQDFFKLNATNFEEQEALLRTKYGDFYDYYIQQIMQFGQPKFKGDTVTHNRKEEIVGFVSDTTIQTVYAAVESQYGKALPEAEIQKAMQHFLFYFPQKKITRVITFLSGFQYGASTYNDSILVIGLDMYLGNDCPFYARMDIPQFIARKLNKENIAPNCMQSLYQLYFDKSAYNAELPLVDAMINEGKKYYFLECMMPDAPDSLIIGYTSKQYVWCNKSEKHIWQYFNEKDLLYKTNFMEQKRYTSDGPSTNGMPAESPGKVGAWVGWQIVRKYMRDAKGKVSLQDLIEKTDTKTILAKAKYKP